MAAIPLDENIACVASFLTNSISCIWQWGLCCLVSRTDSLARHEMILGLEGYEPRDVMFSIKNPRGTKNNVKKEKISKKELRKSMIRQATFMEGGSELSDYSCNIQVSNNLT